MFSGLVFQITALGGEVEEVTEGWLAVECIVDHVGCFVLYDLENDTYIHPAGGNEGYKPKRFPCRYFSPPTQTSTDDAGSTDLVLNHIIRRRF
jgi:hypothetical protein